MAEKYLLKASVRRNVFEHLIEKSSNAKWRKTSNGVFFEWQATNMTSPLSGENILNILNILNDQNYPFPQIIQNCLLAQKSHEITPLKFILRGQIASVLKTKMCFIFGQV